MSIKEIFSKLPFTKRHLYILAATVAILLLYHIISNVFAKPDIVKEVPYVRTVTVGKETVDNTSSYPGEVRGRYESDLAFQVAGKLISRSVNLGDTVKTGDILMQIDPKDIEQSFEASQAAVTAAEANYKLARDNASRYTALYNSGGVSKAMMEQYNTQMEAAASSLRQAQAQLITNSNQLSYTQLIADHDGVVASGEVGQVVAAGTPVVTVVQSGEQEIQIYVPENHLDKIYPQQSAKINFWALENVSADGYIREIAPMADSVTRTYKVRVAVTQMPAAVKLGMTAKVHLQNAVFCCRPPPFIKQEETLRSGSLPIIKYIPMKFLSAVMKAITSGSLTVCSREISSLSAASTNWQKTKTSVWKLVSANEKQLGRLVDQT